MNKFRGYSTLRNTDETIEIKAKQSFLLQRVFILTLFYSPFYAIIISLFFTYIPQYISIGLFFTFSVYHLYYMATRIHCYIYADKKKQIFSYMNLWRFLSDQSLVFLFSNIRLLLLDSDKTFGGKMELMHFLDPVDFLHSKIYIDTIDNKSHFIYSSLSDQDINKIGSKLSHCIGRQLVTQSRY